MRSSAFQSTPLCIQRGITTAIFNRAPGDDGSGGEHIITVIGPLLNTPPLLMGATLWLDPPTPLQWKTIEVCVEMCATTMDERNGHNGSIMATIDAAPMVAVLQADGEERTRTSDTFASIAAIVGYSSRGRDGGLDTFDSASLRESLAGLSSTPFYNDGAKIRLLCIGRAKLSDFRSGEYVVVPTTDDDTDTRGLTYSDSSRFSRDPTLAWNSRTSSTGTTLRPGEDETGSNECEEEDVEAADGTTIITEPVILAKIQLLLDTTLTREQKLDNEFGTYSSPVHALGQLSMWAARIGFLHSDRQRLVQGIHAAQARLDTMSQEWEDHDGIGSLFASRQDNATSNHNEQGVVRPGVFDPNAEYESKIRDMLALTAHNNDGMTIDSMVPITTSKILPPSALRLLELDNYGLGSTPSAFSDIRSMAKLLVDLLRAYYSPERLETEEFEYCVFSWVALQSMMPYQADSKQARCATNTVDRMESVYNLMLTHKEDLRQLALAKSQELRDCGEECDLF